MCSVFVQQHWLRTSSNWPLATTHHSFSQCANPIIPSQVCPVTRTLTSPKTFALARISMLFCLPGKQITSDFVINCDQLQLCNHHFLSPFCGFLLVEHFLRTPFKPIKVWHWLLLHILSRLTIDVCFPLWQENLPFPACNPLFLCCCLYFSKSLRHRLNACSLNVYSKYCLYINLIGYCGKLLYERNQ